MAEVESRTRISIDELVNGTVVSGYVTPAGHLILTTRGGAEIDAGFTGIGGQPVGERWSNVANYVTGDIVGYAGSLWKALSPNMDKVPALYTSFWARLTGESSADWVERDSFFSGDKLSDSWNFAQKVGAPVVSLTTTTGEHETGMQALKIVLAADSSQEFFQNEENITRGSETIIVTVRARLLANVPTATLNAVMLQNDNEFPSNDFGGFYHSGNESLTNDTVVTQPSQGAQSLTTDWATYKFTLTTVNALPRAVVNFIAKTSHGAGATFLIDWIRISRGADDLGVPSEPPVAPGTITQYYRGDKTWQLLDKTVVGLGNVLNVAQEPALPIATNPLQYLSGDKTWRTLSPSGVGAEPAVAPGTTAQYYRGDKTWQSLSFSAVAGTLDNTQLPLRLQDGQYHLLADANDGLESGFYYLTSGVNVPGGFTSGFILVVAYGPNYCMQRFTPYNANISYERILSTGVWSSWTQIIDKAWGDIYYEPKSSSGTTMQYYRGDKTWQTLDKSAVGLSNVDNTSDTNKPISIAVSTALAGKEPSLAAGVSTQYYRGDKTWQTLNPAAVGLGNVANVLQFSLNNLPAFTNITGVTTLAQMPAAGTSAQYMRGDKTWQTLNPAAVGLSAVANVLQFSLSNLPAFTNITGVTTLAQMPAAGTTAQYMRGDKSWQTLDKTAVGLANVDNTSDVNKPVSTAQAASIATKEPVITAGTTAQYWRGDKTWQPLSLSGLGGEPAVSPGTTAQYYRGDKTWQTLDFTVLGGSLANAQLPLHLQDGSAHILGDANLATESGFYYLTTGVNAPTGITFGHILTVAANSLYCVQYFTPYDSAVSFQRLQTNGVWSAWTQVIDKYWGDYYYEPKLAAGTTAQYYRGDKTWQTLDQTAVGLANVDNTSDVNKPVSTLQAASIATKEPVLVAGTTAQYYRGDKSWQTLNPAAVGLSAVANVLQFSLSNLPAFTNITGVTTLAQMPAAGTTAQYMRGDKSWQTLDKTAVGLANVDNTSDVNKPVSTAQAASIATKEPTIVSGTTAQYYRGDKTWQTLNAAAVGILTDAAVGVGSLRTLGVGALQAAAGNHGHALTDANITGILPDAQLPLRLYTGQLTTDWNTALVPGLYYGSTAANGPGGTRHTGIVIERSSLVGASGASQIIWDIDSGKVWTRTYNTTSWSAWSELTNREATVLAGTTAQFYRGDKTWQTLNAAAVGLANVNNTTDATKPMSTPQLAYVQSRGTDLVTNGQGLIGDNTNFSGFTFDKTDAPVGAAGSFVTPAAIANTKLLDEYIPVDPNKRMRFGFQAKQKGTSIDGRIYGCISPYDGFKNVISPYHYMFSLGSTTTLAVDLNPGDTTITLVDASTWYGNVGKNAGTSTHYRSIIWWDYVDAGGKLWAPETYSRNWSGADYWADGAIAGNVIALRAPYSGPARPAGTSLSNGSSGGTYMYVTGATNAVVPQTWTAFGANIVGLAVQTPNGGTSASFGTGWPPGVAYCKLGWLVNRTTSGANDLNSQHAFALVSFSDAAAANSILSGGLTTQYLRGDNTWQTLPAPPTSLPPSGAASGDLAGTYPSPTVQWQTSTDTRAVVTTPNDYNSPGGHARWQFKQCATIGIVGGGTYAFVYGFRGYSDSSGGAAWEYAYCNSGLIFRRTGLTTTWGAWERVFSGQTELDARYDPFVAAGTTAQYYRGDKTWQTLNAAAVGLANVDNTSDVNKPVSTAQAASIATKEPAITAGTTAQYWRGDKTWQPISSLSSGEPVIMAGLITQYWRGDKSWQTLDKTAVGLANVDNTSDVNKPVSTLQAASIATKEPVLVAGTTAQYYRGDKSWQTLNPAAVGLSAVANVLQFSLSNLPAFTNITGVTTLAQMPAAGTTAQYMRGDKSWQTLDKTAVGLANVDNTSDVNKPVSTLQAASIATKEPVLVAGTTAQYYRGDKSWQTLNAAAVGLANVDNTSDVNKPVSTLQAASIATKEPVISAGTTAQYYRGDKTWQNLDFTVVTGIVDNAQLPLRLQDGSAHPLADANLAVESGFYYLTTGVNAPPGITFGHILVVAGNSTYCMQRFTPFDSPVSFERLQTNGVWSAWTQVIDKYWGDYYYEPVISAGTSVQYYRGDKTWQTLDKTVVGLANVDNTSDIDKPVSTLQAASIATKEPAITAGTTAQYWRGDKTWQPISGLSSGEPVITPGTTTQYWRGDKSWQTLDKTAIGLANVDNTSDVNKPVSTLQAASIATKEPVISAGTTAQYYRGDKTWQTLNAAAVGLGNVDNTSDATKNAAVATLANKTLTTPTIASFVNAQHDHSSNALGGAFPVSNLTGTLLVTHGGTGRVTSTTAYGIIAAGTAATGAQQTIAPGTSGQFLKSAGAAALAGFANIVEADVTGLVADLAAKEPVIAGGTTAQFWRGDKTWQTLNAAAVGISSDPVAATAGLRTLGTGAQQAAAGNHLHTGVYEPAINDSLFVALAATGYGDLGVGTAPGGYRKVGKRVTIRGTLVKQTTAGVAGDVIYTLPVGYRPPYLTFGHISVFDGVSISLASAQIGSDGTITIQSAVPIGGWLLLDMFPSFYID